MHIGYLIQQFPPEVGAGAARAAELAQRWHRAGAEVTIITAMPNRPGGRIHPDYRGHAFVEEDWQGITVLRSWLYATPRAGMLNTVTNNVTFLVTSLLHALRRAPDMDVLIASSPPFFPHIAGVLLARRRRIPLVLEVRDLWPDYLVDMGMLRRDAGTTRALFRLERSLLRRAAGVAVVTQSFRTRVIGKGVIAERVRVLPNGVDVHFYRRDVPGPTPRTPASSETGFVLGYMGNFGAGQDIPLIVEAFGRALEAGLHGRMVLTGDGPQRAGIARRIAGLGLERSVTLTPPIPKEETPAFYAGCDACVVPLAAVPVFQETIPSKIFEVMACETPVIGCFGGEAATIVTESGGGLVAPPGDVEAIARAMLAMARTPVEMRRRMGAQGRAYVTARFNRDTIAAEYLDFLHTLSAARP